MNFERWEAIKIYYIPNTICMWNQQNIKEKMEINSQMYYFICKSVHTWIHSNIYSSIGNNASISLQNIVAVLISEYLECDFNGVEKRWIVIFPYIHQEKQQKKGNVLATKLWMLLSSKYLGFHRWAAEKARSTKQMLSLKHVLYSYLFL